MKSWMEGYNSDVEYISGYYKELSPEFINLCAISSNVQSIDTTKEFIYCELGCGQGFSSLVNATMYPHATFYAVDYNPTHIAHARLIAEEAGLNNIIFLENSFQDLVDNPNILPMCDYIVFHGIYTWVNDINRENLVKICNRHLKSGGFVYNSYNAKPGWLSIEPIQQLMWRFSQEYNGNTMQKVDSIIEIIEEMNNTKVGYFKEFETYTNARIKKIKEGDKHYVVHEYLHESWKAFYFTEVAEHMEKAKLTFLTSADPTINYVENLFPEKIKKVLNKISDDNNRELFKDMLFVKMFRKDIYVRGIIRKLDIFEKYEWFKNKKWFYMKNEIPEKFKFILSNSEIIGDKKVYFPIAKMLKERVVTTEELLKKTKLKVPDLIQALLMLYTNSFIALYNENRNNNANKLNKVIIKYALNKNNFQNIIMPYTYTITKLGLLDSLFLFALFKGYNKLDTIVNYIYNLLNSRGMSIDFNGKKLKDKELKIKLFEFGKKWQNNTYKLYKDTGVL